ncbi:LysR family transcriptional regulator [Novilysobacter antarcticus]|uniref:LysR family transcriptional regulator n=1 Tax=Novilysobacter antarcticus TaxID=2862543 RepID=UPI003CCD462E
MRATQSGVSKQLKQFEDGLGFQLFTRRGHSLARHPSMRRDVFVCGGCLCRYERPAGAVVSV